jgi:dGTPase
MTMEGCVVRISDIIGYLGRDIEDAIRLGVLDKETIPESIKNILGDSNRSIVNTIVEDIIKNSYGKDYIAMSPYIYKAVGDLKAFNYVNIYDKANTPEEKERIKDMFNTVADHVLNDLNTNNLESNIYKTFLDNMNEDYIKNTSNERKVIDYIAGMTDYYFTKVYEDIKQEKRV